MEWFYGLLIGSTFTAVLMHLAHRGHKEEREVVKADGTILEKGGFTYQAAIPEPAPTPLTQRSDIVDKLEDVPTDCLCDWHGDHRLCDAEPYAWHRSLQDPECPVHKYEDQEMSNLPKNHTEEQLQRWVQQAELDDPIGEHKIRPWHTDL